MHHCINVFIAPGDSLDDALAPFFEYLDPREDEARIAWDNQRKWDYWTNGGRYSDYWNESLNVVTAGDIVSGKAAPRFSLPFGFVTLSASAKYPNVSRGWFEREIYLPGGFYEKRRRWDNGEMHWTIGHFLPAPNYEKHYYDYVREVPADTLIYVVDVHS
jgi:hypothetical protein